MGKFSKCKIHVKSLFMQLNCSFTFTTELSYLIAATSKGFDPIFTYQMTPRDINFQDVL